MVAFRERDEFVDLDLSAIEMTQMEYGFKEAHKHLLHCPTLDDEKRQ